MNGDSGNHSKDLLFHSVHWWNISQIPRETKREFINSERKYYLDLLLDMLRLWKGDILISDVEELENWTHQKYISED